MAKKADESAFQQLKQDLKNKSLGQCYIFWGEETYLLRHYCQQMKKKLVDSMTEEFNFHHFDQEHFAMEDLVTSVENLPMMAERTMVQVDDVDFFKLPEAQRDQLASLLEDLPEYCCLVFTFETVAYKPDKRLKKLYDAVERRARVVEFAKQNQRELTTWITRHFLSYQKSISPELCAYLIEITGGTMTALGGEIEKIASYCVGNVVRKSDIDAVTEPVLDAVVFQMTDAIGAGDYGLAMEKLRDLFRMQQEPLNILGAVGSQLRRISTARTLMDGGRNADDLRRLTGLGDYPARKTMSIARNFSGKFCAKAAELVLQADWKMKTSYDDSQRLLELLVLQLAQEAKNG